MTFREHLAHAADAPVLMLRTEALERSLGAGHEHMSRQPGQRMPDG